MTTIHYIDQENGSDAADGSSWANAWKSFYGMSLHYGVTPEINGVEVRIAKSKLRAVNHSIAFATTGVLHSSSAGGYHDSTGTSFSMTNTRMPLTSETSGGGHVPSTYGGTLVAPFTAYSAAPVQRGTNKMHILCPATTSGEAVRFSWSAKNMANMETIEIAAGHYQLTSGLRTLLPVTVTITLFTTAFTVPVWSGSFETEGGHVNVKLYQLLKGAAEWPSAARGMTISVNNPNTASVVVALTPPYGALLPDNPEYVGMQLFYKPNSKYGMAMTPAGFNGVRTVFNGMMGSQTDDALSLRSLPARTWDVYLWRPWEYATDMQVLSLLRAGTVYEPFCIYGGWNTETNEMDGFTVLDAANLRLFQFPTRVNLDIRNIGPAFRRREYAGYGSGIMSRGEPEEATQMNLYATNVHVPMAGAGVIGSPAMFYVDQMGEDTLMARGYWHRSIDNIYVSMDGCSGQTAPPFLMVAATDAVNCTFGLTSIHRPEGSNPDVHDCVFIGTRNWREPFDTFSREREQKLRYINCEMFATNVSDVFNNNGGEYNNGPYGDYESCHMHGSFSGPTRHCRADNCTYWPIPNLTPIGIQFTGSNLSIGRYDFTVFSYTTMFYRPSGYSFGIDINITNSVIDVPYYTVTPTTVNSYDTAVALENVTLRHTAQVNTVALPNATINLKDITLVGPWPGLQSGLIRSGGIDGCLITDPNAKLLSDYAFQADGSNRNYGRVVAIIRNVVHPLGQAGLLGSPRAVGGTGAALFKSADGEVWATNHITVARDMTRSHSGVSSWRITSVQTVGAPTLGSAPLGFFRVYAGLPVHVSGYFMRDDARTMCGLILRPLLTDLASTWEADNPTPIRPYRDVLAYADRNGPINEWVKVEIDFTPTTTGAIELYAFTRCASGSTTWFDTIKISK